MWAIGGLCSVAGVAGVGTDATATAASALAAQPAPAFARTVVLVPVGGDVSIHLPGAASGFVPLSSARAVPVGTVVDTTDGRVSLTSANPPPAAMRTQTGEFFKGIFQVMQRQQSGGLVNLVMRDNLSRAVCASPAAHGAALSRRVLGLLRGVARGRFRTTGRFAAATVRGTDWGVRDRCDGTLTVVRNGVVQVRDFVLGVNVVVRGGQTYLAHAP